MAFVYSCCFWFSLRLGGILIGIFSIVHAIIVLVISCIAYTQPENVKKNIDDLMKNMNLIYVTSFLESFKEDPDKYLTVCITLLFVYITFCIVYIYGAFKCNNTLMVGFILIELLRLIILSIIVVIWLLVLKQNTMDIGLVIGASVASGFVLLGMFYLWICAANLPILINEMEREEHLATISKMQRLLEIKNSRYTDSFSHGNTDDLFVTPRNNFTNSIKGPWNYQHYLLGFIYYSIFFIVFILRYIYETNKAKEQVGNEQTVQMMVNRVHRQNMQICKIDVEALLGGVFEFPIHTLTLLIASIISTTSSSLTE